MNKHMIWMIIGCTLPLLFIFFAPALGITGDYSFVIFIVAMFAIHLLIPHHGGHGHKHGNSDSKTSKSQDHENHSH